MSCPEDSAGFDLDALRIWLHVPLPPAPADGVWRPRHSDGTGAFAAGWYAYRTQGGEPGCGLICSYTTAFCDEAECRAWCERENANT